VFAAALLNSQPMGFYAPAQIIRDARAHDVVVRHPDINESDWDCTLEPRPSPARGEGSCALRLGLRQIDGFKEDWAKAIRAAREADGRFRSLDELKARVVLPSNALDMLAAADALNSLDLTRRPGLWAARGLGAASPAPLFVFAGLEEADGPPPAALPRAPLSEEVVNDYETIRLSLKAHPVSFLREGLARVGAVPAVRLKDMRDEAHATVAGVVLVRQRPGSAKGVVFLTLEDESGVANIVVWPKLFERYRPLVMGARLLLIRGRIQHAPDGAGHVTHLVAQTIEDRTPDLLLLSDPALKPQRSPGDGATSASPDRGERTQEERIVHRHPRNVRVLPRSRDFH
jgi:error-prone DNA polymerase